MDQGSGPRTEPPRPEWQWASWRPAGDQPASRGPAGPQETSGPPGDQPASRRPAGPQGTSGPPGDQTTFLWRRQGNVEAEIESFFKQNVMPQFARKNCGIMGYLFYPAFCMKLATEHSETPGENHLEDSIRRCAS
ncbi:unnamed protein product [Arctogadus glacialis]